MEELELINLLGEDKKKCCSCKQVLPRSDFHKAKDRKDGLYASCKWCKKQQDKRRKGPAKNRDTTLLPHPTKTCLQCDKTFVRSQTTKNIEHYDSFMKRRFCSLACASIFTGKERSQKSAEFYAVEQISKKCEICLEMKPITEFPKKGKSRNGNTRYSYCRPCHGEYQRRLKLRNLFDLSADDYEKMLIFQDGVCAVCKNPPKSMRLAVDHDHKTGLVRGLLCSMCNRTAGAFRDNVERFERLVLYLKEPPATVALGSPRFGRLGRTTNKKLGKMGGPSFFPNNKDVPEPKRPQKVKTATNIVSEIAKKKSGT